MLQRAKSKFSPPSQCTYIDTHAPKIIGIIKIIIGIIKINSQRQTSTIVPNLAVHGVFSYIC